MASNSSPSMLRTGARAGVAFATSAALGLLMAVVLGGGIFFFYASRLSGPGMPAAGHAGGAGAILALVFSPPLLVGILLLAFVPGYLMLGMARGRGRAIQQVVQGHGDAISERLTNAIAGRIETMPKTKGALERSSELLSAEAIGKQLAPVLGEGRAVRGMVKFVVGRLPLADVLAEWREGRGISEPTPGNADPALRGSLRRRIDSALLEASTPSRKPLYIAMGAQAALLALGMWLTS